MRRGRPSKPSRELLNHEFRHLLAALTLRGVAMNRLAKRCATLEAERDRLQLLVAQLKQRVAALVNDQRANNQRAKRGKAA